MNTRALHRWSPRIPAFGNLSENSLIAGVLIFAAFAIRAPAFGNPFYHVDEVFYLLVGDRMSNGALPYVDIWDRKPVGLFLIYAAIRLLGGSGVIQYQIVATLFAALTAIAIAYAAGSKASFVARIGAGLVYLAWTNLFLGGGGQAPIFYNLFVICAMLLIIKSSKPIKNREAFILRSMAMLLVGIAIQIKYTVLFEGFFFGLSLLWLEWSQGKNIALLFSRGIAYAFLSLAPTIAAWTWYNAIGYGDIFFHANFLSLFERSPMPAEQDWIFLQRATLFLAPLFLSAGYGLYKRFNTAPSGTFQDWFLVAWCASAVVGALAIGNFFMHYWLPVMVPLSVACASGFTGAYGKLLILIVTILPLHQAQWPNWQGNRDVTVQIQRVAEIVSPKIDAKHCLFVYDGSPWLYAMTNSCLPTRYIFPEHLNFEIEKNAIGVDPDIEMSRIMKNKPGAIVFALNPIVFAPNMGTRKILLNNLKKYYHLSATVDVAGRQVRIFVLNQAQRSLTH